MPAILVQQPADGAMVTLNQPFPVSGQASDVGFPEPHLIDTVTVQVDNGPLIDATLTHISPPPHTNETLVKFTASVTITGGQDPHTITITATNDNNFSATKTVQVFTGPVFIPEAPAVFLELAPIPAAQLDLNDPRFLDLLGGIQKGLGPMSTTLATAGNVLVGPNAVLAKNPMGGTVLRVGLWIVDPSYPVVPPDNQRFTLPRLTDLEAAGGFNLAPLLITQTAADALPPAFAVSLSAGTLQSLLDGYKPAAQASAAQQDATLDTLTITMVPPSAVRTYISGEVHKVIDLASYDMTITETLGTKISDVTHLQVPAVLNTQTTSDTGGLLDWLIGALLPPLLLGLIYISLKVSDSAGQQGKKLTGIMDGLLSAIPPEIPINAAWLSSLPISASLPEFSKLLLDWTSFEVTDSGIQGTGLILQGTRNQSEVGLIIDGPQELTGTQEEMAGGAAEAYGYQLVDLAPDADKFTWQVTGAHSDSGSIAVGPLDLTGDIPVTFPLPQFVPVGQYHFTLTVSARETSGMDPSKILSAVSTTNVTVTVKKGPINPQAVPDEHVSSQPPMAAGEPQP